MFNFEEKPMLEDYKGQIYTLKENILDMWRHL